MSYKQKIFMTQLSMISLPEPDILNMNSSGT